MPRPLEPTNLVLFRRFLFINFIYCIAVILWGALVRATGSGAGCGAHWPSCHGKLLLIPTQLTTLIEFVHRMMSGLLLVSLFIALLMSFHYCKQQNHVKQWAVITFLFVLFEAAIGAVLVIFELTGDRISIVRGYVMGAHLINTFFLVACQWIHLDDVNHITHHSPLTIRHLKQTLRTHPWLAVSLMGMLLVSSTGAVVALGDTLFSVSSLSEGFWQTHLPHAHLFVRLRTVHPLLAVIVSAAILYHGKNLIEHGPSQEPLAKIGLWLVIFIIMQLIMGVVNWLLLVPVATQLAHLGLALIVWTTLIHSMNALTRHAADKAS